MYCAIEGQFQVFQRYLKVKECANGCFTATEWSETLFCEMNKVYVRIKKLFFQ